MLFFMRHWKSVKLCDKRASAYGFSRNFEKGLLLLKVVLLQNFNEIIFLQSSLCFLFHVCSIITSQ